MDILVRNWSWITQFILIWILLRPRNGQYLLLCRSIRFTHNPYIRGFSYLFFIVLFQENVSACQANSSFWFWNKNADWFVKSFSSCKVVFSNTLINQTLLKKISQYYIVFWIWRILLGQKRPNCRWLDIYLVKY